MYIATSAGHIALPIIRIRVAIPKDMPLNSPGVASMMTFMAPTPAKDNPVTRSPRLTETCISVE